MKKHKYKFIISTFFCTFVLANQQFRYSVYNAEASEEGDALYIGKRLLDVLSVTH